MKANEAAALAELIFQATEGKTFNEEVRKRLPARAGSRNVFTGVVKFHEL